MTALVPIRAGRAVHAVGMRVVRHVLLEAQETLARFVQEWHILAEGKARKLFADLLMLCAIELKLSVPVACASVQHTSEGGIETTLIVCAIHQHLAKSFPRPIRHESGISASSGICTLLMSTSRK